MCSQNVTAEEMSSFTGTFDELSFSQNEIVPEEKIAEYKALISKINDARIKWKMNEFVLDAIKTKSTAWTKQIKDVTKSSASSSIELRSENGEITNLLGLEEEDVKLSTGRTLGLSKSAFHDHALEVVRANVAKLKLQKQSLKDDFGIHSMKVMEGMITRERMQTLELHRHVEDLQNQGHQLLTSIHSICKQLTTLRSNAIQNLQAASFAFLLGRTMYLQILISKLKETLDQSLLVDENKRANIDTEGDNLKVQVTELGEELKALQKTLAEYEKKEATSNKYRVMVVEYGKLKTQLEHKNETLKMLNDSDMNMSGSQMKINK